MCGLNIRMWGEKHTVSPGLASTGVYFDNLSRIN